MGLLYVVKIIYKICEQLEGIICVTFTYRCYKHYRI